MYILLCSFFLIITFKDLFILFYVYECLACVPCVCLQGSEEDIKSPETGVSGGCEPPCVLWEYPGLL